MRKWKSVNRLARSLKTQLRLPRMPFADFKPGSQRGRARQDVERKGGKSK